MFAHAQRALRLEPTCLDSRPARGACHAFEGLVAGAGFSETSVFTTPNQLLVPQFAIAHSEITTYTDGRWGLHEYSRWPQLYDGEYRHVPCIPRQGARFAPEADVVWRTWQAEDWISDTCGVLRLGKLRGAFSHALSKEAERVIGCVESCRQDCPEMEEISRFLVVCLRHCVDRLRLLPSERSVIISLAAHVQRLILELAGVLVFMQVVFPRIVSQQDFRLDVLDVVGAHTSDASEAQLLHRVGIPLWFQQHLTPDVRIWSTVMLTSLPICFSTIPSYPRLVLATRDLTGALNTPGECQRAMHAIVRRQLCGSRLPELIVAADSADDDTDTRNKRRRLGTQWTHGWDSSLGGPRPSYVIQNPRDARALPHSLPCAPQTVAEGKRVAKGPRKLNAARPTRALASKPTSFTMNPFRVHYSSHLLDHSHVWDEVLAAVGPLPQPSKSVAYFLPPPWLLDRLRGYDVNPDKVGRYIHHWLGIRDFCSLRLFDRTIAGRPLSIAEWRDALWGDYSLDHISADTASQRDDSRLKVRHQRKQNLRRLFGNVAALPSYDSEATPTYGNSTVSRVAAAEDLELRRMVVWELHETNWRCELLALDAVMVGSDSWPEMERWMREAHVSEVWGASRSGLNVVPDVDDADIVFCWPDPADDDWDVGREPLRAFLTLLSRWKTCPLEVRQAAQQSDVLDAAGYRRAQAAAVGYYVKTFIAQFERLPSPPVRRPKEVRPNIPTHGGADVDP